MNCPQISKVVYSKRIREYKEEMGLGNYWLQMSNYARVQVALGLKAIEVEENINERT